MKIVQAKKLLLVPLSQQIKELGGEGFNSDVVVMPIKNSFSVIYRFNTVNGEVFLLTNNECQVGLIDADVNYHVMFNAVNGEYTLVKPRVLKKSPHKILIIQSLGYCFDDMKNALCALWPNRVVWNITDPTTILTQ